MLVPMPLCYQPVLKIQNNKTARSLPHGFCGGYERIPNQY